MAQTVAGKIGKRTRKKLGRPSTYTTAKAAHICKLIVEGKSLRTICRAPGMPSIPTVFDWLNRQAEFSKQYAHARCAQADNHVEEMLDVARRAEKAQTSEEAQGLRLLVDTLKWRATKFKPKSYGEKLLIAGDPEAPVNLRGEWSEIIRGSQGSGELSGPPTDPVE